MIMTHISKMLFHDDRPCFVNEEISNNLCFCEFGYPSGHTS